MIEIDTRIVHSLGREVAAERMRDLISSLSSRFPQQVHQIRVQLSEDEIDVSFAAYGYVVQWNAQTQEQCILLHGRIPDSARPYRGKIEQAVVARIEAVLMPETPARAA